jgi:type IV pilus biogenesis protein CpaD/CtpE
MPPAHARLPFRLLFVVVAAALLAGCETTGSGVAAADTAKTPEPPMTRTHAAELCWMATEKGAASMALDKRADAVDKCIDEKMKGATGAKATPAG